jgi:hypothetical protein
MINLFWIKLLTARLNPACFYKKKARQSLPGRGFDHLLVWMDKEVLSEHHTFLVSVREQI